MIAAIFSSWPGPDRRIEQRAYDGDERRQQPRDRDTWADHGPPHRAPLGHGGVDFGAWLRQWLAPQTIIALVAFGGLTAVAHYRLAALEKEVAAIRVEYQRRDELRAMLETIQVKVGNIEQTLRDDRRDRQRGQP